MHSMEDCLQKRNVKSVTLNPDEEIIAYLDFSDKIFGANKIRREGNAG